MEIHKIKKIFFLKSMKMIDINAKTYAENCLCTINVIEKDSKSVLWIKMHKDKLAVKNISDLTIKAIKEIYDTETPTKEQIKKYKRFGKELRAGLPDIYIREVLAFKTITSSTVPTAVEFKAKLGFNLYDPVKRTISTIVTNESICQRRAIATVQCFLIYN